MRIYLTGPDPESVHEARAILDSRGHQVETCLDVAEGLGEREALHARLQAVLDTAKADGLFVYVPQSAEGGAWPSTMIREHRVAEVANMRRISMATVPTDLPALHP